MINFYGELVEGGAIVTRLPGLRGGLKRTASKKPAGMDTFAVGIIGMGDMGKMYARRLSDAGWRYIFLFLIFCC